MHNLPWECAPLITRGEGEFVRSLWRMENDRQKRNGLIVQFLSRKEKFGKDRGKWWKKAWPEQVEAVEKWKAQNQVLTIGSGWQRPISKSASGDVESRS